MLAAVGSDVATRWLSPNQERRAGTVFVLAAAQIKERLDAGEEVRADGFFDGERSPAQEVAEAILQTAMTETEEHKLPYLANLYAELCFLESIDLDTANRMLRVAEELSWLELRLVAVVGQPEKYRLPAVDVEWVPQVWSDWTVYTTFTQLVEPPRNFFRFGSVKAGQGDFEYDQMDLRLSAHTLGATARFLYETMRLESIPEEQVRPVFEALCRVAAFSESEVRDGAQNEDSAASI